MGERRGRRKREKEGEDEKYVGHRSDSSQRMSSKLLHDNRVIEGDERQTRISEGERSGVVEMTEISIY